MSSHTTANTAVKRRSSTLSTSSTSSHDKKNPSTVLLPFTIIVRILSRLHLLLYVIYTFFKHCYNALMPHIKRVWKQLLDTVLGVGVIDLHKECQKRNSAKGKGGIFRKSKRTSSMGDSSMSSIGSRGSWLRGSRR